MPIGRSIRTVKEKIKGSEKQLHPYARKFKQVNRASLREDKLVAKKTERMHARADTSTRLLFFSQTAKQTPEKLSWTVDEIKEITEVYLARDDDELEALKKSRRPGRPSSSKQDMLQMRTDKEQHEYKTGYMVPHLGDEETVRALKTYNGRGSMANAVYIRIRPDSTTYGEIEKSLR